MKKTAFLSCLLLLLAVLVTGACTKKEDSPTGTAKVTYDGNGGKFISHVSVPTIDTLVRIGDYIPYPEEPVRPNYIFKGWCEDKECRTLWSWLTKVGSDITLYAKWEDDGGGGGGGGGKTTLKVEAWVLNTAENSATICGNVKSAGEATITNGVKIDSLIIVCTDSLSQSESRWSPTKTQEEASGLYWEVEMSELIPNNFYTCYAYIIYGKGKRAESAKSTFMTHTSAKSILWKNDGPHTEVNWDSEYVFACDTMASGGERYAFSVEEWNTIKNGTFYLHLQGSEPQIRVTTAMQSTIWTGEDIVRGNERLSDNGDGTFSLEVDFAGDTICDRLDSERLLFTGEGYTPLDIYYVKRESVIIWENDGTSGEVSWNGVYRFASEEAVTGEEIYAVPMDQWNNVIKAGTFYLHLQGNAPQIRVTTGWWSTTWTGNDIFSGNEHLVDNGDGTFTLEINFTGDPILDVLDAQHLLFTGAGYTPLKLYY